MVGGKIGVFVIFTVTFFALSKCSGEDSEIVDILQLEDDWNNFKLTYGTHYQSEEEELERFLIFYGNSHQIKVHNERFEKGEVSYRSELNNFTDWTDQEMKERLMGLKYDPNLAEINEQDLYVPSNDAVPSQVDWRQKGAVTPVKNQGSCGACWAFSATGAMEGQHFQKKGELVSLSEQNIVDCAHKYGGNGCNGSFPWVAFNYVKGNNGIDTEESYPYEAKDGQCRFSASKVGATVTGVKFVKENDEEALKTAVATVGPISVGIAIEPSLRFYKSGVYYEPECPNKFKQLGHAVLVVGYGTENGQDYWLVKNSWSAHWGDDGYIKMARNRGNNCGIATRPSFPLM